MTAVTTTYRIISLIFPQVTVFNFILRYGREGNVHVISIFPVENYGTFAFGSQNFSYFVPRLSG